MRVTALLPDHIVYEVKKLTGGKNITESLVIALQDYISCRKLQKAIRKVKESPLRFRNGFSADKTRSLNRKH